MIFANIGRKSKRSPWLAYAAALSHSCEWIRMSPVAAMVKDRGGSFAATGEPEPSSGEAAGDVPPARGPSTPAGDTGDSVLEAVATYHPTPATTSAPTTIVVIKNQRLPPDRCFADMLLLGPEPLPELDHVTAQ
ncbi:MAG: hypothetical protein WD004_07865 [Actinomycetota bacterium]